LPQSERETLQQASVVGRVFWANVVERLHNPNAKYGEPPDIKDERLNNLNGKELIFKHETSDFEQTHEYIFRHAILHDVTYESVLKRLRRAYHAQVAESLTELSGERVGEYAGRIGEHYERAEQWTQAAAWYGRAGKQAQDTYAPEVAISYYQKALTFWEADTDRAQTAQRFEVYEGLGEMLAAQARYTEAIKTFTAMRAAAEATGDVRIQARAWYGLSTAQRYQGDHRSALESAIQAEAAARAVGARVELAMSWWIKGWSLSNLGDAEAALVLGEQMLALTTEIGERRQLARSLGLLGAVHYTVGRYEQAEHYLVRALAICQELDDRVQEMDMLNNLGVIAEARGDYRAAFAYYRDALRIAHEIGQQDGALVFQSNLGVALVRMGEYQAAEIDLRQVIHKAEATGSGRVSDTYAFLAEACLGQGKADEAVVAARRALVLGQGEEDQFFIVTAWRALGKVASALSNSIAIEDKDGKQLGGYDAAACFAESIRICTETGMEGERARALRAWATHELAHGDRSRGEAMWREARQIFAQLGADLEVERMQNISPSLEGVAGSIVS
jgi:tetratricopeptide (TPR) repeat protein